MTRRPVARLSVVALLAVLAGGGAGAGVPALAVTPTCDGKAATIVGPGPGNVIHGTPGDDVVVTVAEPGNGINGGVHTYEGDDTVCIVPGTGPEPYWENANGFTIRTGPGDDKVLNQEPRSTSDLYVVLGIGSDTFVGNDRLESVVASEPPVTGWLAPDDAQDFIFTAGGPDRIMSGSPGTVNHDVISTGLGSDEIRIGGTGTTIDNGIEEGRGDHLFLVGDGWDQRRVTLDNRTKTATGDAGELLRWNNVSVFQVRTDSPLRYVGAESRDILFVTSARPLGERGDTPVEVSMNGGDDHFWFYNGIAPGRVDGGAGSDKLVPEDRDECLDLVARLDDYLSCTVEGAGSPVTYDVALSGWEEYEAFYASRSAAVTGTSGPDEIWVRAPRVEARGLGGNDLVQAPADDSRSVLRGDRGADRLVGGDGRDTLLGGRGADKMYGRAGRDRLHGGGGRDKSWGGSGTDRCRAEVLRSCERR